MLILTRYCLLTLSLDISKGIGGVAACTYVRVSVLLGARKRYC